jgi:hypothetical protein
LPTRRVGQLFRTADYSALLEFTSMLCSSLSLGNRPLHHNKNQPEMRT